MSVKKKRTIGPCRGVTWLYYVVLLWLRDFFLSLYLDPRFRPLLLKYCFFFDGQNFLNLMIWLEREFAVGSAAPQFILSKINILILIMINIRYNK